MNFTTKETYLLEDQKNHEKICVQKYSSYANMATDPELKSIFQQNGQKEQEHYNTLDQLLKGQVPSMSQSSSQQSGGQQSGSQSGSQMQVKSGGQQTFQSQGNTNYSNSDKDLCTDMLMTEKYVSGAYNTAIFEFRDPQVRSILNHIQKEEQQHGEAIFKYMEKKGMYQMK
jgi:spore coat protein CotF